mgnify:CR=1 FL=1
MQKNSKFYAIVKGKCPHCRIGDIFTGNTYGFNIQRTNAKCAHCNQRFEIEPGYFYAAMYVSYALGIAFGVAAFIITYFFVGEKSLINNFIVIIATLIVFMPIIMRLSRNIWINMFISYDKDWKEHINDKKKPTLR